MIYLQINSQEMTGTLTSPLVAGQINFVDVKTFFDASWDGLDKSYQFRNGDRVVELESNDEVIQLPYEATLSAGCLEINVSGKLLDADGVTVLRKATANYLRFKVIDSNAVDDPDNVGDVSATVVEQIRNIAETAEEKATEAERLASEVWAAKESGALNGKDGRDGKDGTIGRDGVSPTFETQQIEGGAKITITDVNGTHEVLLEDGPQGETGPRGEKGDRGERGLTGNTGASGKDGVSPTVKVEETSTGAKITVTDVNGTTTANLYNGKDGEGGGIANETDPIYTADKPKLALKSELPTKVSQLTNDSEFITDYTETDPIYLKDKPNIALKSELPTTLSQLTNDSGFMTNYTETDPIYLADKPNLALKSDIPDITGKQDTLVSGENIKTINGESILGSGNIVIEGGSGGSGGSGGGNRTETELLSENVEFRLAVGATKFNSEIILNEDISNFDEVIFIFDFYSGAGYTIQSQYPKLVSLIKYNTSNDYGQVNDGSSFMITSTWIGSSTPSCASMFAYFKNGTTLAIGYTAGNNNTFTKIRFVSIKGIKY